MLARAIGSAMVVFAVAITSASAFAQSDTADSMVDFTALDEPRFVSIFTVSDSTYAAVLSYLDNAIQVIDITDPASPKPVAVMRDGEGGFEALRGGYMITTAEISGSTYALAASYLENAVQVANITDPTSPEPVAVMRDGEGGFDALLQPKWIEVVNTPSGVYALVASFLDNAINVIDITDPASPKSVAVMRDGEGGFEALGGAIGIDVVTMHDTTYAFVVSIADNALQVIDITNPTSPDAVAAMRNGVDGLVLEKPTHVKLLTVDGHTYALVLSLHRNFVSITDVTNPNTPAHVAGMHHEIDGFTLFAPSRIAIVDVPDATYAIVSSFLDNSLQVIDITDLASPEPVTIIKDGEGGFEALYGASALATFDIGDSTYVLVTSFLDDAVQIMDVTNPEDPEAVAAVFDAQDVPEPTVVNVADDLEEWRISQAQFNMDSIESRVIATVLDTAIQYNSDPDGTLAMLNAGTRDYHYPFILDENATVVMAHGAFPEWEGLKISWIPADRPLDRILDDLSRDGGTWVNHMSPHPHTGVVQQMRSWLYSDGENIFGAGYYLHEVQIQTLVQEALDNYKAIGYDAIDMMTPDEQIFGYDPYVFVVKADTVTTVAHAITPSEVGTISDTLRYKAEKPYSQIVDELEKYGHTWISYVFINPDVKMQQLKRAWLQMYDGYIFVSGYYLTDSRVQSLAEGAQLMYQSNGEVAFDIITPDVQGPADNLHAYVLNATTNVEVANGVFPQNVGKVFTDVAQQDRPTAEILESLTQNPGEWITYVLKNPSTNTEQVKRVWMQLHDGYIFASGYYLPDSRVQATVDLAVSTYQSVGADGFDRFLALLPINTDRTSDDLDISEYAVLTLPASRGVVPPPVASIGGLTITNDRIIDLYRDLIASGSVWIERVMISPDTATEQVWRSWAYVYDNYIFQSGYFVPDSEVQSVVDRAVFQYDVYGEAAFDIITPEEPVTDDIIYSFVITADTYETVAHETIPDQVGVCCSDAIRFTGDRPFEMVLEELNTYGGAWVTYTFVNPNTGTDQNKRTWLYLHDGYIFGSGYYISDSQVQAIVRNAIHTYDLEAENTFDLINALSENVQSQTYPFVINATTYEIISDGHDTDMIGAVADALVAADRPVKKILAALESSSGTWSHYMAINPVTGAEEMKRTWLSLHDGYIFGSGYHDTSIIE